MDRYIVFVTVQFNKVIMRIKNFTKSYTIEEQSVRSEVSKAQTEQLGPFLSFPTGLPFLASSMVIED